MRTVLIFAYECAPYNSPASTIGSQRPAQFARHLPAFGWRPIVVCCDARRRGIALASEITSRSVDALRAAPPDGAVIIATPSLSHFGVIDKLWRRSARRSARAGRLGALARRGLTMAKQITSGDYSSWWRPCAWEAARAVAKETKIDVVMAEHSPDASLYLSRALAKELQVPWIADFRDPAMLAFPTPLKAIYTPVFRRLLSTAARTIQVNPYWADLDLPLLGHRSDCIPNGFDEAEFQAALPVTRSGRFTIGYYGNIIPEQNIDIFLSGFSQFVMGLPTEERRLARFQYRGLQAEALAQKAEQLGISDEVEFGPSVARSQAIVLMRTADILLLLSVSEPERQNMYFTRGFWPGKVFELFGAARPILCVPGDRAILEELVARTQTGVSIADSRAIARYLEDAYLRWRGGASLPYAPDATEVARFTRRAVSAQLARVLDDVVSEHRRLEDGEDLETGVSSLMRPERSRGRR